MAVTPSEPSAVDTLTTLPAPTTPGWYSYAEKGKDAPKEHQVMIFLLTQHGTWYAMFDNGDGGPCVWGYIEQALGVFDLVPLLPLASPEP